MNYFSVDIFMSSSPYHHAVIEENWTKGFTFPVLILEKDLDTSA